ncbi:MULTISPECIES: hypothetical protein [unclassified Rhodococcus (in: high G+C Gram-positive bacteria)]|uniref:hypothetical protein n=1 Tax=unclassified Rhodococcus (in: high G+C Gram-positive bacteria) TaxID=192944 RepID=UPI00163AD1CB|nr:MULTISPECIES: hypothetical protein [unclassified Rhodococcus (in: high G+C Gram-positive bacteria)]MBC2644549.1 hypothetical protein [Rhodococcus sp. 3A]MBC2897762.1 hypothetical protein [Rhodococcus sp. 4CII]
MSDTASPVADSGSEIVPGVRVRVREGDRSSAPGTVVEDFAEEAAMTLTREWAPVRRWAVALDDGRLVFADDVESEPAHRQ